jgi:putative Mg2+ transporter-C (MgtC) family protein
MHLTSFVSPELVPFIQIVLASLLGMILGIERLLVGRTAGPRTYGLVATGACLMTIISVRAVGFFPQGFDPAPMIASILTGIGFLGAGLIIFQGSRLSGVTTAAGIWVSAIIGITVGFNFYILAIFTTLLTLFIFTIMWRIEHVIAKKFTAYFPPSQDNL